MQKGDKELLKSEIRPKLTGDNQRKRKREDKSIAPSLTIQIPKVLIFYILNFVTLLQDYRTIILVCKLFLSGTKETSYLRMLPLSYPLYITKGQLDAYADAKIDYKAIVKILCLYKKFSETPEFNFDEIETALQQFLAKAEHKIAKTSLWVLFVKAPMQKDYLALYEQALGKPEDKDYVAAAAIKLCNLYGSFGVYSDTQFQTLKAAFDKTNAVEVAFHLGQHLERFAEHRQQPQVQQEAVQWYEKALTRYLELKIGHLNHAVASIAKFRLNYPAVSKELFDFLQCYYQFDMIIEKWQEFKKQKIVDIDQKTQFDTWRIQLYQSKNSVAVCNLVLFYSQYFKLKSSMEFKLSKEQILLDAKACIDMIPNAKLRLTLEFNIGTLKDRYNLRDAKLAEKKLSENPSVDSIYALGALNESNYLSSESGSMYRIIFCQKAAYWYTKFLAHLSSQSHEDNLDIQKAKQFLSLHPREAKQAYQQVSLEIKAEIPNTAPSLIANRYRLTTGSSAPSTHSPSSPKPLTPS